MISRYHRLGLYWGIPGLIFHIPLWFLALLIWLVIAVIADLPISSGLYRKPLWWPQVVCWLPASVPLMIGLAYSAKAKGRHPAWCVFGLLNLIGYIVLGFLSDKHKDEDIELDTVWPLFFESATTTPGHSGYWKPKPAYWIALAVGLCTIPVGGLGVFILVFLGVAAFTGRGAWRNSEVVAAVRQHKG